MFPKQTVYCPVCNDTLGYLTKGEVCSYVCTECQWIFTWNRQGKMTAPIKVDRKKKDTCDCGSCQYRDEHKYLKRPQ